MATRQPYLKYRKLKVKKTFLKVTRIERYVPEGNDTNNDRLLIRNKESQETME